MLTNDPQFYTAIKPLDAYTFFQLYLALPVVIAFYIVGYIWKRQGWLKLSEIDVDGGRRELDMDVHEKLQAELRAMPAWKRHLSKVF